MRLFVALTPDTRDTILGSVIMCILAIPVFIILWHLFKWLLQNLVPLLIGLAVLAAVVFVCYLFPPLFMLLAWVVVIAIVVFVIYLIVNYLSGPRPPDGPFQDDPKGLDTRWQQRQDRRDMMGRR